MEILRWRLSMMTRTDVLVLMASSKSRDEWKANFAKVIADFGTVPAFWVDDVVISGLHRMTLDKIRGRTLPIPEGTTLH